MSQPPDSRSLGIFYSWWRGDPLPSLSDVLDLAIEARDDHQPPTAVPSLDPDEVAQLTARGDRLYVARRGREVVAWGWCATATLSIGELGIEAQIPPRNRYLWGFVTLPAWRGQGIYPRLLQAMLVAEDADRFWLGHDESNEASARGILKAGFTPIGPVYESPDGRRVLVPDAPSERVEACVALFGIPPINRSHQSHRL